MKVSLLLSLCFSVFALVSPASSQSIRKVGDEYVHHTARTGGKARELRSVYYPTFKEIGEVLAGTSNSSNRARRIEQLEARLPTRAEVSDTMIRSVFTRPSPETNIAAMPNAAGFGSKQYHTIYDAMPRLRSLKTRVSPLFDELYNHKEYHFLNTIRTRRSTFYPWTIIYDCDTVLEMGSPKAPAGQRALFFHSDMDIDADGSDGPRYGDPKRYSKDGAFQPETSYRWKQWPSKPNPFLKQWKTRKEFAEANIYNLNNQLTRWNSLKGEYGHQVTEDIALINEQLKKQREILYKANDRIKDMSQNRYLVGELDPFIVCPLSWTDPKWSKYPFQPSVGDLALVFYGKKIYPCLFADQGPHRKAGEASMALARQLRKDNPRLQTRNLTAESSCFWDIEVSYIVFPGTAKPASTWGPLDMKQINQQCVQLIANLGGVGKGFSVHQW